jgi:transposase-like protein
MSEEEGWEAFVKIRFAETEGEPFCPRCGCAALYAVKTRRKWKCKSCTYNFSVTSGTVFASHKLAFRDILLAIALYTNGAKGISALQLARDLNVQAKTAFVMLHKLREALGMLQHAQKLSGEVEVDGAYYGGYVKPSTRKENRRDRRKLANQNGKRKCVTVMRERNGRTRPFICSELDGALLAPNIIENGSIIYADEAKSYDSLHALFNMKRIDHSKSYAEGEISTNQAESFHSRMRRSENGVQRWLGLSAQGSATAKWIACRLVS